MQGNCTGSGRGCRRPIASRVVADTHSWGRSGWMQRRGPSRGSSLVSVAGLWCGSVTPWTGSDPPVAGV